MMKKLQMLLLLLFVSANFIVCSVSGYGYLIDCGSSTNTSLSNRTFYADDFYSGGVSLSATQTLVVAATNSTLLLTARIFTATSSYTFPVQAKGRNLIRLHFFPFSSGNYNLSQARFSVSAQNVTLLRNFQLENVSVVVLKEYSFDIIVDDRITITFSPNPGSLAFINALEVFPLPTGIIPDEVDSSSEEKEKVDIRGRALETSARVNMGNASVHPENDTIWRLWDSDAAFLRHQAVYFVKNLTVVSYFLGGGVSSSSLKCATEDTAPPLVYGSGSMLDSDGSPTLNANLTWIFNVDPGFEYLVRFHFCDIVKSSSVGPFRFQVYINSRFAYQNLNLDSIGFGVPFYFDVITRSSNQGELSVSVGPLADTALFPMAILNGLEIMKISNSKGSLDVSDIGSLETKSRTKFIIIAVSSSAVVVLVAVTFLVLLFLGCTRRRRRRKIAIRDDDINSETVTFSSSKKIGYRFPLAAIEEATDKFSESLLIGVGGFGKVYEGVLRDGTKIAVKRGNPQSRQEGLLEFRTEIEMLSQFRHRHLVSLIGYCDERNEMVIIYEFMENGTLKDHLYGSVSNLLLSWKQRLEICIGSAKGLHYLHTGSAKAIIHRDVKSANILLDGNFMAKVADFGLSKAGPDLNETHVSTAIKGSFGYLDPEYLTRQQLTEKSDVYSFGVVMLEVMSGRPVIDPSRPREEVNLVEWAMKWQRRGKLHELVDPRLQGQMREESLLKFVRIADKCLAEQGAQRPPIGDVLWNLEFALQLDKEEEEEQSQSNKWLGSEIRTRSGKSNASILGQSLGSMGDLDGVSMSKVFANMIQEEPGHEMR